jgi:hypothetical protein
MNDEAGKKASEAPPVKFGQKQTGAFLPLVPATVL